MGGWKTTETGLERGGRVATRLDSLGVVGRGASGGGEVGLRDRDAVDGTGEEERPFGMDRESRLGLNWGTAVDSCVGEGALR